MHSLQGNKQIKKEGNDDADEQSENSKDQESYLQPLWREAS
jgi:hypothetical protein